MGSEQWQLIENGKKTFNGKSGQEMRNCIVNIYFFLVWRPKHSVSIPSTFTFTVRVGARTTTGWRWTGRDRWRRRRLQKEYERYGFFDVKRDEKNAFWVWKIKLKKEKMLQFLKLTEKCFEVQWKIWCQFCCQVCCSFLNLESWCSWSVLRLIDRLID